MMVLCAWLENVPRQQWVGQVQAWRRQVVGIFQVS